MEQALQPAILRLFIALPISSDAKEQLRELPRKGLDARWAPPDDLHITLRFIGETPEEKLPGIKEALARVKRGPFQIEMKGLGVFDGGRQAVLWAALQGERKLTALAGDINEILAPLGFEMPNKPYKPHITVARLKDDRGIEPYIKKHGKKLASRWQATSFGLYLSATPDEQSRRYRLIESYPLFS